MYTHNYIVYIYTYVYIYIPWGSNYLRINDEALYIEYIAVETYDQLQLTNDMCKCGLMMCFLVHSLQNAFYPMVPIMPVPFAMQSLSNASPV